MSLKLCDIATGSRRRLHQVYLNLIIVPLPFQSSIVPDMFNFGLFLLTAIFAGDRALAAGVSGAAEGFAKGVTGGGSATAVYPTTNAELVSCTYDLGPLVLPQLSPYFLSKLSWCIASGEGAVY